MAILSLAAFADRLKVVSAPWLPFYNEQVSGLGTGELLTASLGADLREAEVMTAPMPNAEAKQLMATIESLGGARHAFYMCDPMALYPQADPDGTILGSSTPTLHTVTSGSGTIRITGLPVGYVITIGDMIALDYGTPSRRAFLRASGTVTADGAGLTPAFAVTPALRPGIVAGLAVILKKPAAKVKMLPGTLALSQVDTINAAISFRVRQTLQAG